MIDREQFNRAWRMLCKRLRRDLDAEEAADYRAWLSERMDTDQFLEAARHLWATCKFFPEPTAFIEAIRPSVEAEALEQWELCGQVMAGSKEAFIHMSLTGKRTVRLLGGPDRLRNTKLDQVPFVRRDFLKLFGDAEEIYRREKQRTALPLSDKAKEILASAVPLLSGGRLMQEASGEGT